MERHSPFLVEESSHIDKHGSVNRKTKVICRAVASHGRLAQLPAFIDGTYCADTRRDGQAAFARVSGYTARRFIC